MALKNHQYQSILRSYDMTRQRHHRELEERRQAIYKQLPDIKKIDDQLIETSIQRAKLSLLGDASALNGLAEQNKALSKQKQQLLKQAGYPVDALELQYTCPDCKDTGYIEKEKCHCMKQAITDLLYTGSGLKETLKKDNFSTFSFRYFDNKTIDPELGITPLQNIKVVLTEVRKFLTNFGTEYQNLFFFGNTGVGKTFLSSCIAKELLDEGFHVIYLTAHEFFTLFETYSFHSEAEQNKDIAEQFTYLFECDLLIIDDLGTELTNAFTNTRLYSCMNERYLKRKATIISTNLSLQQFRDIYSERIFSRITGYYTLLKLIGSDIRVNRQLDNSSL